MYFDPGTLNELIELLTRFHCKRLLVRTELAVFIPEVHDPAIQIMPFPLFLQKPKSFLGNPDKERHFLSKIWLKIVIPSLLN